MNKLSTKAVIKTFQRKRVLDGVSLTAQTGQIVGLLGLSGCGKTTLLRCIAGIEVPESGEIVLGREKHLCSVGLVFQQAHLWPHLTLLENLTLAPRHVLKIPKKIAEEGAQVLLSTLGLENKGHVLPIVLSGGEQQRGAIARALMMRPHIMLFDEPTSALDPERSRVLVTVLKACALQGMTILIATHDIPFIKKVASQVLFLEQGKIIEKTEVLEEDFFPKTTQFIEFLSGV